jgi:anti-sigma B factor antagonist
LTIKPFSLSLDSDQREDSRMMTLAGFLDAQTVGDFELAAEQFLDSDRSLLILDLHDLQYISSAGVGSIMALVHSLRRKGGDVVLVRPSLRVYDMLELLGFTEILQITQSREEAEQAFRGKVS